MVGETGWQLSMANESPLHCPSAAQDADLVVLDESLAALDPETFIAPYAACLIGSPPCS